MESCCSFFFKQHSDSVCLLIRVFNPVIFKGITDKGLMPFCYLFSVYYMFFVTQFLHYCLLLCLIFCAVPFGSFTISFSVCVLVISGYLGEYSRHLTLNNLNCIYNNLASIVYKKYAPVHIHPSPLMFLSHIISSYIVCP